MAFDARDAVRLAQFWGGLLGRVVVEAGGEALLPGDDTQVGLRFVPSDSVKAGANRLHLHLTSATSADQERTVSVALELGAAHLDVGQLPEEGHIVLADPEGNEFCVIEAGNKFLAGCGFLGEVACDGGREVGVFWSEAMGWPLVWDQDEETAIQSPHGGTKVAWGGPSPAPTPGTSRQRFDVTPASGDQLSEIERLIALGATLPEVRADLADGAGPAHGGSGADGAGVGSGADGAGVGSGADGAGVGSGADGAEVGGGVGGVVVMVDPGGNEFLVRAS
ncbi:VOC family protein [Winogradskya humida]